MTAVSLAERPPCPAATRDRRMSPRRDPPAPSLPAGRDHGGGFAAMGIAVRASTHLGLTRGCGGRSSCSGMVRARAVMLVNGVRPAASSYLTAGAAINGCVWRAEGHETGAGPCSQPASTPTIQLIPMQPVTAQPAPPITRPSTDIGHAGTRTIVPSFVTVDTSFVGQARECLTYLTVPDDLRHCANGQ